MRPYIIGLNQPQVGRPALCIDPPGCAGHRLWQMVNEVSGISGESWLASTQRVNLLSDATLPRDYRGAAARRGEWLGPMISGRVVVILGQDVANALEHPCLPLIWDPDRDWVMIPHPSGRNLFYNNPIHRLAVGILLSDVLRGCVVGEEVS